MTAALSTAARRFTLLGTAFLLLSIGGAGIVAAPVTLPLLYAASASSRSRGFRTSAVVVACLTAAEAGFGVAYLSVGYDNPFWWMFSILLGLAALVIFGKLATRRPASTD